MFGMVRIGEVASEDEFKKKLEKKGYHIVESKIEPMPDGKYFITGICIYIRNLSPELKRYAKTIKKVSTGDTITWTKF